MNPRESRRRQGGKAGRISRNVPIVRSKNRVPSSEPCSLPRLARPQNACDSAGYGYSVEQYSDGNAQQNYEEKHQPESL